jgi:hypothetical protein
VGSYSPVPTDTGGIGGTIVDILKGIFGGGGGNTQGGGSNANYYNMMFPQQQQQSQSPMMLPFPVGSGNEDNLDFGRYWELIDYMLNQANPYFMAGMDQMGQQLDPGYARSSQQYGEGANQLLLGGNLAEQLGMGKGISTPQQQQLQSSIMGNVNTGGLTPETVAAMQRLILEPQQEQFMGNINKLAGGGALLTSPAYQEMVRRNDQNFTDQMTASAFQNMPQYYNLANQISSQPMQQGMNLGQLFQGLGGTGLQSSQGYYGQAGNLGLGMNQISNNALQNISSSLGNLYNTQQSQQNAANIARAQAMGMAAPWIQAGVQSQYPSWPNWPSSTGTIPGMPSGTTPKTPYTPLPTNSYTNPRTGR